MKLRLVVVEVEWPAWLTRSRRSLGFGVFLAVLGVAAVAYAKSWSTGEVLEAKDLNDSFAAIEARLAAVEKVSQPAGAILFWACPSSEDCQSANVPSGYWVCDGSTVNAPGSPWHGRKAPDLRNAFPMGVELLAVGSVGGANSVSLAHTHGYSLAHTHQGAQTTSAGGHEHVLPMGFDRTAIYLYMDANQTPFFGSSTVVGSRAMSSHTSPVNGNTRNAHSALAGEHKHEVSPFSVTDRGQSDSAGATIDLRPRYVGLLPLLKL